MHALLQQHGKPDFLRDNQSLLSTGHGLDPYEAQENTIRNNVYSEMKRRNEPTQVVAQGAL